MNNPNRNCKYFYIVPKDYYQPPNNNDNDNDNDLPPPPPPFKLKRTFKENDRPMNDPYFISQNKDKKMLCKILFDAEWNINGQIYYDVLLVCPSQKYYDNETYVKLNWLIEKYTYNIKYYIPRFMSDDIEENAINGEDFHIIDIKYKSIFYSIIKFKIILTKIRNKKRMRLFLNATYDKESLIKQLKYSINYPVRNRIIQFLIY